MRCWRRSSRPLWCCPSASSGNGTPGISQPVWIGDGRIAFVTGPRNAQGRRNVARAEIWSSNPDGTARRRLVGDVSDLGFRHLGWDPTRSRLYYIAELAPSRRQLWWVDMAGVSPNFATVPEGYEVNCCEIATTGEAVSYTTLGAEGSMEIHVVGRGRASSRSRHAA